MPETLEIRDIGADSIKELNEKLAKHGVDADAVINIVTQPNGWTYIAFFRWPAHIE